MRRYVLSLSAALLVLAACGVPTDQYDAVVREKVSLKEYQSQLEERLTTLGEEFDALSSRNAELESTAADLENEVLELNGSLEDVRAERDSLEAELAELKPLVDDEALQLELEQLRQERDQLLDGIDRIRAASVELAGNRLAYWAGLMCTGSMDPFIDCGDVGIYLQDPGVEEINVGDVVDFPTVAVLPPGLQGAEFECLFSLSADGSYLVHRVTAKTVREGTTYYQTKGDANVNPDPCWIPYEAVNSKLVRVLYDVRPEDVTDTVEYDAALEEYRRLEREYNELKAVYDERRAYYDAVETGYLSGAYSHGSYQAAWENLEKARLELIQVRRLLNVAADELDRIEAETFGE